MRLTPWSPRSSRRPSSRFGARLGAALAALVILAGGPTTSGLSAARAAEPAATPPADAGAKIDAAIERGANWLMSKQNPDGGYGPPVNVKDSSDVGLTSFALYALARCPRKYRAEDGPYISKAVKFLLDRQQADGSFYDPKDKALQNYRTSVAVMALTALDPVKYAPQIAKAAKYILEGQLSEASGADPGKDVNFGGLGYGGDKSKPDLSNTQIGAEALHAAGISGADEVWVRMQKFLARCQNFKTDEPLVKAAGVGTTKDGGFRYQPAATRGASETVNGEKVFSSYGSMTYAGLKTMLYAQMKRDDPRVLAAYEWIRGHFTVESNPGMGTASDPSKGLQGLFYYYHTMAKSLTAFGEPVIVDEKNQHHVWAQELGDQIASLQSPEGWWRNKAERWMENVEVLDTSYALIALSLAREELERVAKEHPELLKGK